MKKIQLIIPFIKILFTRPSVIFKALYHAVINFDRQKFVENKYGLKNGLPELDLLELFPVFNGTVSPFTHLYGTSLPIDMLILKSLAQKFTVCDYMEIGTWRGESIANLSPVCNQCVSISLSDDDMRRFGFSEKHIQVQRFFSKDLINVKHIEANSRIFDFHSLDQKFDLIFVDGDHSFDGVKNDTQKVFELLKNENSIIIWHDYTTQYELIDWEVFAGILEGTPKEKRKNIYHITNSLCAIYINGDFKTGVMDFPAMPDKKFEITIAASKL